MPSIKAAYRDLVQVLQTIYDPGEAQSIARIFFEDRFRIYRFDREAVLSAEQVQALVTAQKRLLQHEPLQYILGTADFFGLKLKVNPAVLIPRPETEELVDWILTAHAESSNASLNVLDIGTGSACIPIVLKKQHPQWQVQALELSAAALEVARENAQKYDLSITFWEGSALESQAWDLLEMQDIIVSNPPYIPPREKPLMPQQVIAFEPELALFVDNDDPLLFYRRIAEEAQKKLRLQGWLYYE
ncbi:MAG: peptide chain release factor N(5)-glutamine methyltransferase [Bacteroidota bacterium]